MYISDVSYKFSSFSHFSLFERNFEFLRLRNNRNVYLSFDKMFKFYSIISLTTIQKLNVMLMYVSKNSLGFELRYLNRNTEKMHAHIIYSNQQNGSGWLVVG